jgi:hypothetical protein
MTSVVHGFAGLMLAALLAGGGSPIQAVCTPNILNDQEVHTGTTSSTGKVLDTEWWAQTFTVPASPAGCFTLNSLTVNARTFGSPQNLVVAIHNVTSGAPSGAALAFQSIVPASVSNTSFADLTVTFTTPAVVSSGGTYAVVARQASAPATTDDFYRIGLDDSNTYSGGQFCRSTNSGASWTCSAIDFAKLVICLEATACPSSACTTCCTLSQGAYGNSNTVANCDFASCNPITGGSQGFITGLVALGGANDPFGGDPNATTIGCHATNSVTVDNQATLIAYLPATGGPGQLTVSTDAHYSSAGAIPDPTLTGPPPGTVTGSGGQGGGTLSSQAMSMGLNLFMSGKTVDSFTVPAGLALVTFPSAGTLFCTKRAGPDKILGNGDDVCEAFSYPNCVAGKTVSEAVAAANAFLCSGNTTGQPSPLNTCTGSDLDGALATLIQQYDACGQNIACTDASGNAVVTPGVFTCP